MQEKIVGEQSLVSCSRLSMPSVLPGTYTNTPKCVWGSTFLSPRGNKALPAFGDLCLLLLPGFYGALS